MNSKTTPLCRRFSVTGRVQGVFYRDSTRREALRLGLCGHARNLPDGSVEVIACGSRLAIESLLEWMKQGPPMAAVESVIELGALEGEVGNRFQSFNVR